MSNGYESDSTFTTYSMECPICDETVVTESRTAVEQVGRTQVRFELKEHIKAEHSKYQMLVAYVREKWSEFRS